MTTKSIVLDVWNKNNVLVTANQGEVNSRFIEITITDKYGAFDLTGKSVQIYLVKPDGEQIYNDAIITDAANGIIEVGLTSQMSASHGFYRNSEIRVINSNGHTLKIKGLSIFINQCMGDGAIESTSEFTALEQAISETTKMGNHINNGNNPHNVTTEQIGAISNFEKGMANGVATLGSTGKLVQMPNASDIGAIPIIDKGMANGVATLNSKGKLSQMPNANDVEAIPITDRGIANGVATLDSSGKLVQIPTASDVGAVSATEKGIASGVATLNSSGKLSQMPNPGDVGAISLTERGAANGVATLNSTGKLVQMPTVTDVGAISSNEKGAVGGVATLNSSGKLISSQLDTSNDAYKIKLLNLSEEVQAAMAGTAPVVSSVTDGSLTASKYAESSIINSKLNNNCFIENAVILKNLKKDSNVPPIAPGDLPRFILEFDMDKDMVDYSNGAQVEISFRGTCSSDTNIILSADIFTNANSNPTNIGSVSVIGGIFSENFNNSKYTNVSVSGTYTPAAGRKYMKLCIAFRNIVDGTSYDFEFRDFVVKVNGIKVTTIVTGTADLSCIETVNVGKNFGAVSHNELSSRFQIENENASKLARINEGAQVFNADYSYKTGNIDSMLFIMYDITSLNLSGDETYSFDFDIKASDSKVTKIHLFTNNNDNIQVYANSATGSVTNIVQFNTSTSWQHISYSNIPAMTSSKKVRFSIETSQAVIESYVTNLKNLKLRLGEHTLTPIFIQCECMSPDTRKNSLEYSISLPDILNQKEITDFRDLGDVKNTIDNLKSVNGEICKDLNGDGTDISVFSDFLIGTLSNGVYSPNNYKRAASESIITFNNTRIIRADEGFKFGVHTFRNGVFYSDSGWQTYMVIAKDIPFKIVVARNSTPEVAIDSTRELTSHVHTEGAISILNNAQKIIEQNCIPGEFMPFATYSIAGEEKYEPLGSRSLFLYPQKSEFDIEVSVSAPEGIRFGILQVSNLAQKENDYGFTFDLINDTGWQSGNYSVNIPRNTYYFITFGTLDNARFSLELLLELRNTKVRVSKLATQKSIDEMKKVPWLTASHRGYTRDGIYMNTLPAYKRAIENGADYIEGDTRRTSDGIYVMSHDATISGTVDGVPTTYTIAETTYDILQNLVLSEDLEYGKIYIAKLQDVLNLVSFTGAKMNLDCKNVDFTEVAKMVVSYGLSGRVMYQTNSSSYNNADIVLQTDPNAGFVFAYEFMNEIINHFQDPRKIYIYISGVPIAENCIDIRTKGFSLLISEINSSNYTQKLSFYPDLAEFQSNEDFKNINKLYLNSINI